MRKDQDASVERFNKFIGSKFINGRLYVKDLDKLLTDAREYGEKKGEFSKNEFDDVVRYNWQ